MKKPKAKRTPHKTLKSAMKAVSRKAKPPISPKAQKARPADTRWPSEITVGKRHRKDYGDLKDLASSIDARGALLQPIVIDKDNVLIAGERRLRAWKLSKFASQPIPVHVVDIDAIIAGEWDENAKRKDFTPSEAVAIRDEIERKLKVLAAERQKSGKAADPSQKGEAAEQASAFAGKARRTLDKAKEIVSAAKENPEKYKPLKDDMDRTGKVNGPYNRLKVMKQTEAIQKEPPGLPMEGEIEVAVVDFPWPNEPGMTQAEIDAAGRSLRPYPAMAIQEGCKFMAEQLKPKLADDCVVWFLTTNYHLINGHADKLLHALGFAERSTMLTWEKDKIGRGQILRDKSEHCIVAKRGKPVINIFGKDPPTTMLKAGRRENSRKPDELYRLIERVCPAKRYASIFSRGGEGERWDSHGDQVGKYAPGCEPKAPPAPPKVLSDDEKLLAALKALKAGKEPEKGLVDAKILKPLREKGKGGKPKLSFQGRNELQHVESRVFNAAKLTVLTEVSEGKPVSDTAIEATLRGAGFIAGKGAKTKLTTKGSKEKSSLEDDARDDAFVLALPKKEADLADLADFILDRLRRRAAAAMDSDQAEVERLSHEIELAEESEGYHFQIGEQIAAPPGEVPVWQQDGMFVIEVAGIPAIVVNEEGRMEAFAVDPDKPFLLANASVSASVSDGSATIGEVYGFDIPLGVTMKEQAESFFEEALATDRASLKSGKKAKGKSKTKTAPVELPLPEQVYVLRDKWPKGVFGGVTPKKISASAARKLLAAGPKADEFGMVRTAGGAVVAKDFVTKDEALTSTASSARTKAPRETKRKASKGGNVLHGQTFEQFPDPSRPKDVAAEVAPPTPDKHTETLVNPKHVASKAEVSAAADRAERAAQEKRLKLLADRLAGAHVVRNWGPDGGKYRATCECGVELHACDGPLGLAAAIERNKAVEAHWTEAIAKIEAEAAAADAQATPAAESSQAEMFDAPKPAPANEDDQLDIPPYLKRSADQAAE